MYSMYVVMLCYVMLYVMFYVVHQMIDWLDSQLIYKVQDSRLKDPNSQFGGEAQQHFNHAQAQ
ncbi:MAG: hypothetical protein ACI8RD_013360 [Bacillariaceae sp.]|jgi:hypothetical protein